MTQTSRTFRIFVSSTFNDLKAERNALQEFVFPSLRTLAESHGCRFQAIDLRWGVSDEATHDQQTMKICLGEIARCQDISPRPNFIILLGNRYGWRPLPCEIPVNEYDLIFPHIPPKDRPLVVHWYRRDDNSSNPMFILQARAAEYIPNETWVPVEQQLHRILESAAENAELSKASLVKYTASATEQEINQGTIHLEDACQHVFSFAREIDNLFENIPEDIQVKDFVDCDQEEPDPHAAGKLTDLKTHLKAVLGENYREYKAHWEEKGLSMEHLDQLCKDVYHRLEQVILQEIAALEQVEPLEKEIAAHQAFGDGRASHFIGRAKILSQIDGYLLSSNNLPLAVWGESGSGKSALMAKAIQLTPAKHPSSNLVYRFIGVTPDSSNGRSLLYSLCHQITRLYAGDESTIPSTYNELVQAFPQRMALATAEKPLIVFLDALDQLSDADNSRNLTWLPSDLPANTKLVVSTLPGKCRNALVEKIPDENHLELQPMPLEEGEALLDLWLEEAGRTLTLGQRTDILAKYEHCGLPLYLKLAFEEARHWHSYDGLPKGADDVPGLGEGIPAILDDLFWRLSRESNHGQVLVERSLGYLAAAKNGLSEDELLDVLSSDAEMLKDFHRRSPKSPEVRHLPVVVWSRLFLDLEPYLSERSADGTTLLVFYHPTTFGKAILDKYLVGDQKSDRHRSLAEFFVSQPLERQMDAGGKSYNLRKISEQVFQQLNGEMWGESFITLTDFDFLEARCLEASVYDLETDYLLALQSWQGEDNLKNLLMAFEERLRLDSHIILRYPEMFFPQFYNHLTWLDELEDGPIHAICERSRSNHHNWLRMIQDPRPLQPSWQFSLGGEGHTKEITALALTPDGRQIVSGSNDKTLKVWDMETGLLLRSLDGHNAEVNALAITPDGRNVISGSSDKTLKIWDLESGRLLRSLESQPEKETVVDWSTWKADDDLFHTGKVITVALSPDGHKVVSGSDDKTIKVWDFESGKLLRSIQGHTDDINAVAISPDGRKIISGSGDNTLRGWDLESGQLLFTIVGPSRIHSMALTKDSRQVICWTYDLLQLWDLENGKLLRKFVSSSMGGSYAVALTPDNRQVVSMSYTAINIWELDSGRLLRTLKGSFHSMVLTPDGRQIVSGSFVSMLSGSSLATINVWDLESGGLLRLLKGQTESINALVLSPDGKQVVSASDETEIKVWDLESGQVVRTLEGHMDYVNALVITRDGKQVISGSIDKTIKVWDLESGKLLRSLGELTGQVTAITLTPDGRQIISASTEKGFMSTGPKLSVWELESGQLLDRSPDFPFELISGLVVAPNKQLVISGGDFGKLQVLDLENWEVLRSFKGHFGKVKALAITPDGRRLISGADDNTLKVWDMESERLELMLEGHTRAVTSITLTPDGRQVVSGADDNTLKVWDLESGRLLRTFEGHKGGVHSVAVTPDGRLIVSGSVDKTIKVWNLASKPRSLRSLEGHTGWVYDLAITPDNRKVVSGSKWEMEDTIKVWDVESGQLLHSRDKGSDNFNAIAQTLGEQQVISTSDDTGEKWDPAWFQRRLQGLGKHNDTVTVVIPTSHGSQVVSAGSWDGTINVWDPDPDSFTPRLLRSLEGHTKIVYALVATPEGRQIISGSWDHTLKVWDLESGRALRTLEGHTDDVMFLSLDPCSRQVVSGSSDKTLKAWEWESGRSKTLFVNDIEFASLSISSDGRWLACGDQVGRVWIFEWIK